MSAASASTPVIAPIRAPTTRFPARYRSRPMLQQVGTDALLEADPDLGAGLSPDEFEAATKHVRVAIMSFEPSPVRGKWGTGSSNLAGLLVVEGALLREVRTARRVTGELI